MLLITVTDWRHKTGVIIRLLLFLLLIWLITPQFLGFLSGHVAILKNLLPGNQSSGLRIEQQVQGQPQLTKDQGAFLKMLQEYYFGNAQKHSLPNSD